MAAEPEHRGHLHLQDVTVLLDPTDDVAIAKVSLEAGLALRTGGEEGPHHDLTVREPIRYGHKVAVRDIASGEVVRRYGQIIGVASASIHAGEHVHDHNLVLGGLGPETRPPVKTSPPPGPQAERGTFLGFQRPDRRAGTRNYVAVISTVNCSAHTCLQVAHHFTADRLACYPNVDGVIALTYRANCSMRVGGPTYRVLQRTLAGMARHPNVGAALFVGLGCETNQACQIVETYRLATEGTMPLRCLSIQELGGIQPAVRAGIETVEELLPIVDAVRRTPQPLSELVLALQCGGSDGWSGVTANPLLGLVADEIVNQGGTAVLAETPEIYGAEHLLASRAIDTTVSDRLKQRVRWWERHARSLGSELDNNPTPGNKAGGLTTIFEKALGAVAKGGRTPLMGVYNYAERLSDRGLLFMDSPGFDPVSVTGQVASGCNLVLFSTGRGSVFGFKPAPSIKIASNSQLFRRMPGDMDLNAGRVLDGEPLQKVAADLLNLTVEIASGRPSKSEAQGVGEAEFSPWHLGETL